MSWKSLFPFSERIFLSVLQIVLSAGCQSEVRLINLSTADPNSDLSSFRGFNSSSGRDFWGRRRFLNICKLDSRLFETWLSLVTKHSQIDRPSRICASCYFTSPSYSWVHKPICCILRFVCELFNLTSLFSVCNLISGSPHSSLAITTSKA